MTVRHLRVCSRGLMVTAEREGPADGITCIRQRQLGESGEMDLQKLCSPRVGSPFGTLLTVFLEQLCRTEARCSRRLELALELAIFSSITAWYTARQGSPLPICPAFCLSWSSTHHDDDDIVPSRVLSDQTSP
jgi:hypothetical protein